MNYLQKFKEKCGIDDKFCENTTSLVNKLVEFGYINKSQIKDLYKKLYENVDVVLFGRDSSLDFKTGYFDAVRKELYLQNIENLESFYLRLIYVFTTTKITDTTYDVGYSTAFLGKKSYKIEYKNFSINRAIVSNLVCRLLYTTPTALTIAPTYRTYENTFLGNKISADNDIYFLEGRLLTELCFILNSNEEELYINLFDSNPNKFLEKFLKKNKFKNYDEALELLDTISKLNSNYNKLCFLNKLLDENYINIKKNILNEKEVSKYKNEEIKIKMAIKSALLKLNNSEETTENGEINIDHSLSETINKFENDILEKTYKFQSMLVKILINTQKIYKDIDYAVKLKKLQTMLVTENDILENELNNIIKTKLISSHETNSSNLIEKIKYSLVNHTLDKEKFIKSYKDLSFKKLNLVNIQENSSLVAFELENTFLQLFAIENINFNLKSVRDNVKELPLTNLGYLLNSVNTQANSEIIEKLYTSLKEHLNEKLLKISDIYISEYNKKTFAVLPFKETYKVFELNDIYNKNSKISIRNIPLSESFNIFTDPSKMPILYAQDKRSIFKRILNILTITFWC